MDLNRHQFLFIGLMVLLIGLQVRYVSAYRVESGSDTVSGRADRAVERPGSSMSFAGDGGNVRRAAEGAAAAGLAVLVPDLGRRGALSAFAGDAAARLTRLGPDWRCIAAILPGGLRG